MGPAAKPRTVSVAVRGDAHVDECFIDDYRFDKLKPVEIAEKPALSLVARFPHLTILTGATDGR